MAKLPDDSVKYVYGVKSWVCIAWHVAFPLVKLTLGPEQRKRMWVFVFTEGRRAEKERRGRRRIQGTGLPLPSHLSCVLRGFSSDW